MLGTVQAINASRGTVAVATESAVFTIIEMANTQDVELYDVLWWQNAGGMGSQVYENVTTEKRFSVSVRSHAVPARELRRQLLLD